MSVIGGKADEIIGNADISTLTKCVGADSGSSNLLCAPPIGGLARVAAGCRFTLRNREGAEAYETNIITDLQRAGNVVEHTVNGPGCVGPRDARRT